MSLKKRILLTMIVVVVIAVVVVVDLVQISDCAIVSEYVKLVDMCMHPSSNMN